MKVTIVRGNNWETKEVVLSHFERGKASLLWPSTPVISMLFWLNSGKNHESGQGTAEFHAWQIDSADLTKVIAAHREHKAKAKAKAGA